MRWFAIAIFSSSVIACGSVPRSTARVSAQAASAPSAANVGSASATYPAVFPVLDDLECAFRTNTHEARTPGWSIQLDSIGMLSSAEWTDAPKRLPAEVKLTKGEHALVDAFLQAQRDIVAVDAPFVVKKYETDFGVLYQQVTKSCIAASVHASRIGGVLTISGHLWPRLPEAGTWIGDDDAETRLRALDSAPDLSFEHRYNWVARSERGPLELREAVCLATSADMLEKMDERPNRPCLDARTGEDITLLKVGQRVSSANGVVTSRSLVRLAR
jgi:hypothetical protein